MSKYVVVFFLSLGITLSAQRTTRVGYIDMNVILENIEEYQKANDLLEKNIVEWKKEIELKKIQLKQYQDQFLAEKVLLTPELIEDRELELQDFASELIDLQERRFGVNGNVISQRTKLLQPIQDQVLSVVKQIAEERKYDYIFDRSSNGSMLYSAKNYDISALVLQRINIQQRRKQRKQKIEEIKQKANSLKIN